MTWNRAHSRPSMRPSPICQPAADADAIQNALLDVGRAIPRYQDLAKQGPHGGPGVKLDWFQAIYEVLLARNAGRVLARSSRSTALLKRGR